MPFKRGHLEASQKRGTEPTLGRGDVARATYCDHGSAEPISFLKSWRAIDLELRTVLPNYGL